MTTKGKIIAVISTIAAVITIFVFLTGRNLPDWFNKNDGSTSAQDIQTDYTDNSSRDDYEIERKYLDTDEEFDNAQTLDATNPPNPVDLESFSSDSEAETATDVSIANEILEIQPYTEHELNATSANFQFFSGLIDDNNQEDKYTIFANESGPYRFELNNMISGFKVSMYLYDEDGDRIDYNSNIGNGSGLTVSLNAGEKYTLSIKSYIGTGTYDLTIGEQKAVVDISRYTTVRDEIEYTGQEIYYNYTPLISGIYHFEIAQINYGIKVSLYIYDDAGYRVDYNTSIGQGSGVTVTLEEGQTYRILIAQNTGVGEFSLTVGSQKVSVDISSYSSVIDSTQYSGQSNNYYYTARVSGTYRFEINQINSGIKVSLYVYDMAGYRLEYSAAMSRGSGVTVSLEAGQTYLIQVVQYSNYGEYTIAIGSQKETLDISGLEYIEGSIQYTDQVNNYTFTPSFNGTYTFEINDLISEAKVSVYIYDDAGYRLGYSTYMRSGSYVKADLEANKTYTVQVIYSSNYSSYILNIIY